MTDRVTFTRRQGGQRVLTKPQPAERPTEPVEESTDADEAQRSGREDRE